METNFNKFYNNKTFPTFYPTYEEWKLFAAHNDTSGLVTFLSYLWGMETKLVVNSIVKLAGFLSYLWGMETITYIASNICNW
mgnify:CR=1 FL=1